MSEPDSPEETDEDPDAEVASCAGDAPVDDRLFFAGEACSPNFYSTAHGAWLTGITAAEAALASFGKVRAGLAAAAAPR